MYILTNTMTGKYVSRAGSIHRYTSKFSDAQIYARYTDAFNARRNGETVKEV